MYTRSLVYAPNLSACTADQYSAAQNSTMENSTITFSDTVMMRS